MLLILLFTIVFGLAFSENANLKEDYDVGCNNFHDVVNSAAFVDKSALIREFFRHRRILVTAPPRFGKSINTDMIKTFCEVLVDNNGNRVERNCSKNYKVFSENNLQIFQDRVFFDTHFGKYPVIYLDFKSLTCGSYDEFLRSFETTIANEFDNHEYLLGSSVLSLRQIRKIKTFFDRIDNNNLSEQDLLDSVYFLSRLLFIHFHRTKCILFIDEFDGPIQDIINNNGSEIDNIYDFNMKFISRTLQTNPFIERALINSCVKLSGAVTNQVNNIEHITFLSHPSFAKFYGFMESEVKGLLERFSLSDKINDVKLWYDGYQQIRTKDDIYNGYSIIRFLESRVLRGYWSLLSRVKHFETILSLNVPIEKIELLLDDFEMKGNGIQIQYKEGISLNDVVYIKEILNGDAQIKDDDTDLLFQYFTENGYFNVLSEEGNRARIRVPNMEIKREIYLGIERNFIQYYRSKFKEKYEAFRKLPGLFNEITESNHLKYMTDIVNNIETCYWTRQEMPAIYYRLRRDLFLLFTKSKFFENVFGEMHLDVTKYKVDVVLETKHRNAFMISLGHGLESSYEALQEMVDRHYDHTLSNNIKMKIFLAFYLNKKGCYSISYLVKSSDINEVYNVTSTLYLRKRKDYRTPRMKYTHKPGNTRRPRRIPTTF